MDHVLAPYCWRSIAEWNGLNGRMAEAGPPAQSIDWRTESHDALQQEKMSMEMLNSPYSNNRSWTVPDHIGSFSGNQPCFSFFGPHLTDTDDCVKPSMSSRSTTRMSNGSVCQIRGNSHPSNSNCSLNNRYSAHNEMK